MHVASLELNTTERRRLRHYLNKVHDKATYVRMLSVYRVGLGEKPSVVADQLQVSVRAVYKWVHLFLEGRTPEALVPTKRCGRPRGFTELTDSRILSALEQKPHTLGYPAGSWTVATLTHYLNGLYGTSISTHTLRRRLKELGLRYKRPRYVYEEKAPALAQKKGPSCES